MQIPNCRIQITDSKRCQRAGGSYGSHLAEGSPLRNDDARFKLNFNGDVDVGKNDDLDTMCWKEQCLRHNMLKRHNMLERTVIETQYVGETQHVGKIQYVGKTICWKDTLCWKEQ